MTTSRFRSWRRWTREVRPTLSLASPIVAGMLSHMLIGLADTVMIGRVGVVPLAAASFVNAITHLPMVFGIGLLSSIAVLSSQAYGARQEGEVGEVLRHGTALSAGMGVVSIMVALALLPCLGWFGQPAEVVEASRVYLVLFGISMLPLLVVHGLKQFSEACNRAWVPNGILLGGVVLNVVLNWILIYGHWGAPALGLNGAGWATLLARFATLAGMIIYILWAPALRCYRPAAWWTALRPDRFRRLIRIGWPVAAQHFMEVSAFVFAALMMGWIGARAIAAHQIAITCAATTFMLSLGIGMAVCIRVGQAWGAGQHRRMRRIGFLGLGLSGSFMSCFALVFFTGRFAIASWFVASPETAVLAGQLLLVAALFQVADGLQVVAISGLRGLSDVRVPALVAVLAYWVVAVPLGATLAFGLKLGAVGIWIGLATGLGLAAVLLTWRFHRKTRMETGRAQRLVVAEKWPLGNAEAK